MTDASNFRFNAEAAAWDSNPDVQSATKSAVKALLARFPELERIKDEGKTDEQGPNILEIGCGTGLLSLQMAPYARSLLAIDAAEGMIAALSAKLTATPTPNVQPLCIMLTDPEDPALEGFRADLVLSHLVLHHIPELEPLLKTMVGCLRPGGWVALTDFEDVGPESRKFHPEAKMSGVERDGIKRTWFEGLMKDAGLVDVVVEPAWTMIKEVERFPGEWGQKKPNGPLETMPFPFLLCVGRRPE